MTRRDWTTTEIRKLVELLDQGFSTNVISEHLPGRSPRAVWDTMRRRGIVFPAGSEHLYHRPGDGKLVRGKTGPVWTAAELDVLKDLDGRGLTDAAIAHRLPGRTPNAVGKRRRTCRERWRSPHGDAGGRTLHEGDELTGEDRRAIAALLEPDGLEGDPMIFVHGSSL